MSFIYETLRVPSRWAFRGLTFLRVEGAERVPSTGPVLLVPNHQSVADPFLVQAFCARPVHAMTKSTQFASVVSRWLVPRLHGFPVRRHRVDPQAVRVLLRLLEAGEVVCVYPEGERTWDGNLQPLRWGALRVILRAGVPVVPVGIEGMYDLWPRWRRRPSVGLQQRVPVTLRYGEPMHFGQVTDRAERERRLPHLHEVLQRRLRELSGAEAPDPAGARPDEGDADDAILGAGGAVAHDPRTEGPATVDRAGGGARVPRGEDS